LFVLQVGNEFQVTAASKTQAVNTDKVIIISMTCEVRYIVDYIIVISLPVYVYYASYHLHYFIAIATVQVPPIFVQIHL